MAHLLVEDTVPLVDVGNVALILIVPLPRELALLVDATMGVSSVIWEQSMKTTYSLLILATTRSMASSLGLLSA